MNTMQHSPTLDAVDILTDDKILLPDFKQYKSSEEVVAAIIRARAGVVLMLKAARDGEITHPIDLLMGISLNRIYFYLAQHHHATYPHVCPDKSTVELAIGPYES